MRRLIAAVLATLCLVTAAPAQTPPAATSLVKASAAKVTIHAGGAATATVHLEVAPGWHVYSNPPSLDYNIPTKVGITGAAGIAAGKPAYPPGRSVKLASDEQAMSVYDGALDIPVPLTAAASAANGPHALRGSVAYQSCNDQMCLAPVSVPFTVEVTIEGGAAPGAASVSAAADTPAVAPVSVESRNMPTDTVATRGAGFMTAPPADGGATKSASQRKAEDALKGGWLWWLLFLFGGGLALNLTPCVFPMLSITVSIFGARRAEATPRVLANAVAYVLGIIVTNTTLGVVAGLTGGLFGSVLQNPLVLVGVGVLLLVLSLSMFGVYEMQAPLWLLDRAGGANTGSLAGLFFSGLAVGVIAAPCIAGFLISVLVLIAQKGSMLFGMQTMFTVSLGLGAPYLVLAAFSNQLGKLPRAGDWMDWVKKLFGVTLVSLGLFYILNGVAARASVWVLPSMLVLGGLYLGFMEKSGNAMKRFRAFKQVLGGIAAIAGVALVLQITAATSRALTFKPYDDAAVSASIAAGRGVVIDFGADWCVPCHELELQVFPDKAVIAAAKPFDCYKADLTHGDSPAAARFGVHGVPTIILLGPGGVEARASRVEGLLPAADFARRLTEVAATLKH
jgi:thiol:disulfide interchange protein DsbD